jgi:hypothetical protein
MKIDKCDLLYFFAISLLEQLENDLVPFPVLLKVVHYCLLLFTSGFLKIFINVEVKFQYLHFINILYTHYISSSDSI